MKKEPETRQYRTFTDDFIEAKDQDYAIPEGYKWVRTSLGARIASALLYGAAAVFSSVYCRLCLHMHIENAQVLRQARQSGAFIYANHTQPLGDVFIPALAALPRRVYVVVSPANLSIPVIGRLLPYLGALPLPDDLAAYKNFIKAVDRRIAEGHAVGIYPEAHIWPYYTKIRPFKDDSFHYPVRLGAPVFCFTNTYQKRKRGKKPKIVTYVDGPFFADESVPARERKTELRNRVYDCMVERSKNSNLILIEYKKKGEKDG